MYKASLAAVSALLCTHALASNPAAAPAAPAAGPAKICKFVVTNEPGTKPVELCLTKAEWDAKALADANDATRIVCKYQEVPGSRFRSAKICMSAAEWDEARRLDREAVEHIQRSVCVAGGGC